MSCLSNIVTLSDRCSETIPSLSGYDLMQAPEISPLNLAGMANEKYVSGYEMARKVLDQSLLDIKNDFLAILTSNNIASDVFSPAYSTSEFNPGSTYPAVPKERGLTIYKTPKIRSSNLKKLTITKVSVLPLNDKEDAEILVYDNGNVYAYPIDFTANLINTIEINHVVEGPFARVLVDNTDVSVASSTLTCFTGCNGKLPNDCGYTKGYNGDGEISNKEGFGVGVEFKCECDYEILLCDLSKTYAGKLIWLKARIGLLNERIYSNRFNDFIIYGKEEAIDLKKDVEGDYIELWNTFVASLPNMLRKYGDDCINCKGIRIRTNI